MSTFLIMPHSRLQEWVAEERGYFAAEALDYRFVTNELFRDRAAVQAADGQVTSGAFESMEAGRACDVSAACHWAVNMASSAQHGRMWGHAYSVTSCGIMVPPESPIRTVDDLRGVEVGVGYHSGSHFSTMQTLAAYLKRDEIKVRFIGAPWDRIDMLLNRQIPAATVFGMQKDLVEQQGFRKVVDASFMIGFLVSPDADPEDVRKYFNALRLAQRDIDLYGEQFKHYYLRELPERYHSLVDVRAFSAGERIVFEPYTQEMFEATHRWLEEYQFFDPVQAGNRPYQQAVLL